VQSKRFTRINPLKSCFPGSPSMKDVQKRFNLESKNPQTGTPQSLIFAETPSQATPNASKANLFKTRNECMSSKNSSKAVKFDKCRQPLVLRCVSRLGVASQASFIPNERPQGKNGLIGQQNRNHTNSIVLSKTNKLKLSPLPKGAKTFSSKNNKSKAAKNSVRNIQKSQCGKEFWATHSAPCSCIQFVKHDTYKFTLQLSKV
jgi:hypothetical protein